MPDSFHPLTSVSDWDEAKEASDNAPVLIFKHSSACSVSAQAKEELERLADAETIPIYRVVVQDARSVSDRIEDDLEVRHETPQAIILEERTSVFDTSHFEVTADTIRDELQERTVSSN